MGVKAGGGENRKETESRGVSANFTPKDMTLKLKEGCWQELGIRIVPLLTCWTKSMGVGGQGAIAAINKLSTPKKLVKSPEQTQSHCR